MTDSVTAASPAAEETIPSAAVDTAAPEVSSTRDATSSDSSPAGEKPSIFDAVKASLTKEGDKEAPPADAKPDPQATEAKPDQTEGEDEADDKGELSEDEKKVLSAKTQRRIQKLARQRDDERVVADRTRQMDAYMHTNGISPQDAIGAFEVMALMRSNPQEALSRLRGISYELALSLGEVIPKDIQDRINSGTIDEATGKELAIARAQSGGFKQAAETLHAQTQAEHDRGVRQSITQSVNEWEASVTQRDPDFAAKKPLIETHFRALLQAGEKLHSKDDAVRLMKKAYEKVNEDVRRFRPAERNEVKSQPATSTAAKTSAPKSYEEAIRGAFAA